jgi:cysteine-rich repeat protein
VYGFRPVIVARSALQVLALLLVTRLAPAADPPKAVCGNGKIEVGETCDDGNAKDGDSCPSNCRIEQCVETSSTRSFAVFLEGRAETEVQGVTVFVRYPEGKISIPSGGSDDPVKRSISDTPPDLLQVPNDLDYGLREVMVGTKPFHPGRLFTIQFRDCQGATPPAASELHCTVEDAADSAGGSVRDLRCSVRSP